MTDLPIQIERDWDMVMSRLRRLYTIDGNLSERNAVYKEEIIEEWVENLLQFTVPVEASSHCAADVHAL